MFRVRSLLHTPYINFSRKEGCICSYPIITGSDAEGAGQMFKVTTLDITTLPEKKTERWIFQKTF